MALKYIMQFRPDDRKEARDELLEEVIFRYGKGEVEHILEHGAVSEKKNFRKTVEETEFKNIEGGEYGGKGLKEKSTADLYFISRWVDEEGKQEVNLLKVKMEAYFPKNSKKIIVEFIVKGFNKEEELKELVEKDRSGDLKRFKEYRDLIKSKNGELKEVVENIEESSE